MNRARELERERKNKVLVMQWYNHNILQKHSFDVTLFVILVYIYK